MTIVADRFTHVIGVDTHARTHTFAVLESRSGALVACETFPVTPAGFARALSWIGRRTGGLASTLVVIEGAGSYGAGLARAVRAVGLEMCEASTPPALRQGRGKSDPIDAELIGRQILSLPVERLRQPRQDDGIRAATKVLLVAREQLAAERVRLGRVRWSV